MRVPNGWGEVTIGQFQELLPIYKKALEEKDTDKSLYLWANVIAILTDSQTDEVEALPIGKLKSIINKIQFLSDTKFYGSRRKLIYHKGKLYRAFKDVKEFNVARTVEYKTFLGRGFIPEMHNLLATIYQPVFKSNQSHEQRASEFKSISVKKVYPTLFFYTNKCKNSMKRIQDYGKRIAKEKMKEVDLLLMQTLKESLESIGDGTR